MTTNVVYVRGADGRKGESWPATIGCGNRTRHGSQPGSEGCRNCWAEPTVVNRVARTMGLDPPDFTPRPLPGHLADPLAWTRPRTVFASHMGDWLDPAIPIPYAAAMLGVAAAGRRHTCLFLTKQAARLEELVRWIEAEAARDSGCPWTECHYQALQHDDDRDRVNLHTDEKSDRAWPPPNAWLGVTVCDASEDWKLAVLRRLAAAGWNTWASLEPLLSALPGADLAGIRWCTVGCDNAPRDRRRPMELDWARELREVARRAGCGFHLKQAYSPDGVLQHEPGLDGEPCNGLPWSQR